MTYVIAYILWLLVMCRSLLSQIATATVWRGPKLASYHRLRRAFSVHSRLSCLQSSSWRRQRIISSAVCLPETNTYTPGFLNQRVQCPKTHKWRSSQSVRTWAIACWCPAHEAQSAAKYYGFEPALPVGVVAYHTSLCFHCRPAPGLPVTAWPIILDPRH